MQLELKYLAPYLPYGLKFSHKNGLTILNISTINYWFTNYYINPKPILRPLSDLNRLGEENIPINEHTINMLIGNNETYGDVEFSHYKGVLDFIIEGCSDQRYDSSKTINLNTFEAVRIELLKGHFDIFGLIEKGLAIDINTLK